MTPCQNPHFILARFYTKFLSAGNKFDHSRSTNQGVFQTPQANVQSCHSYRNSCPPASALYLQWVDLCLPLEGRGQIPGRAGGKKNFELQLGRRPSAGAVAVRDAPASQPDSTATGVSDSHASRFAAVVGCPREVRTPFCGADTHSVSHEKWCGQRDPGLILSLGAQRALGMQRP